MISENELSYSEMEYTDVDAVWWFQGFEHTRYKGKFSYSRRNGCRATIEESPHISFNDTYRGPERFFLIGLADERIFVMMPRAISNGGTNNLRSYFSFSAFISDENFDLNHGVKQCGITINNSEIYFRMDKGIGDIFHDQNATCKYISSIGAKFSIENFYSSDIDPSFTFTYDNCVDLNSALDHLIYLKKFLDYCVISNISTKDLFFVWSLVRKSIQSSIIHL